MKWSLVLLGLLGGCGDNSKRCGMGTIEIGGECIGGGDTNCGPGTVEQNGECVPEALACMPGQTAVEGRCVQIDLEEGAEPNGFEIGANPAGQIALEPVGGVFTITGCMNNQPSAGNESPDFDLYHLAVTEPVLVRLTVDGRGGMVGGFLALGPAGDAQLASYRRLGLDLDSDQSRRQVFLPKAGTYRLAISDTRTLMPSITGGTLPAAGNPDGVTSCYLVHAEVLAAPAPKLLALGTPVTGTVGEEALFFTAPFGTGFNGISAVIDPADLDGDGIPDITSHAQASLVVMTNGQFRQVRDDGGVLVGGVRSGDQAVVVLDHVYNYALEPVPYAITLDHTSSSVPLKRDGTTTAAVQTKSRFFIDPATGESSFANLNLFHWVVTEANTIDGMNLTWSIPLQGVVRDETGAIVANFTGQTGNPTLPSTFSTYRGLLRLPAPGTYYFTMFAPRHAVGTSFTATSTIASLAPVPIVFDMPTAAQTPNAFNSNPFDYDAGTVPWQQWTASGTNTGTLLTSFYDPATAFGRFDTLAATVGNPGTPVTLQNEVTEVETAAFLASGTTRVNRILKNPIQPPALTRFLVKVNPQIQTGTRSFVLDFGPRDVHDFGPLASGSTTVVDDEPLTSASPQRRFYLETEANQTVAITVQPNIATLDPVLGILDPDETERRTIDSGIANQAETTTFTQNPSGFTAFVVRRVGSVTADLPFTVTVKIEPPKYAVSATTTPYSDACAGGVVRPVSDGDDGLTAAIPTIAGFRFFGAAAPSSFIVSTNGFLGFGTTVTDPAPAPSPLPDEVGEVSIAPLWQDLVFVRVCTKTAGGKQIIQWTGDDVATTASVEVQAILDPADDSIEFVYGPHHAADGSLAATGIQRAGGLLGFSTGQFGANIPAGTSRKLTPVP